MPREAQSGPGAGPQGPGSDQSSTATPGNTPGGGIGEPINTPDPLNKYKWWILGGLGLLLVAAAGLLLRKPPAGATPAYAPSTGASAIAPTPGFGGYPAPPASTPAAKNAALLNALKEELFALESEKLSGTITAEEYAEIKPALEVVLKRALKRN